MKWGSLLGRQMGEGSAKNIFAKNIFAKNIFAKNIFAENIFPENILSKIFLPKISDEDVFGFVNSTLLLLVAFSLTVALLPSDLSQQSKLLKGVNTS